MTYNFNLKAVCTLRRIDLHHERKKPIHERQNKGKSELLLKISSPGSVKRIDKDELYLISYKYGMKGQVLRRRGL